MPDPLVTPSRVPFFSRSSLDETPWSSQRSSRTGLATPASTASSGLPSWGDELLEPSAAPAGSTRFDRRDASCWSLAVHMTRALMVASTSLVHQFFAQSVAATGRAGVQTALAMVASRSPHGRVIAGGVAEAVVLGGIVAAAPRAVQLVAGTMAGLRGDLRPPDTDRLARVESVVSVLAMLASVVPAMVAWGRADDEGLDLGAQLLVLQAGRTCQNLMRDMFTQSTRRAFPSLRYVRASDGQVATSGSAACQAVMLDRTAATVRLALTLASYAATIALVTAYAEPAAEKDLAPADPSFAHDRNPSAFMQRYAFGGLLSAAIEGIDSFNTTLAIAVGAWCGGARAEIVPAEGLRAMTWDGVVADVRDAASMRLLNNAVTVDVERGVASLRGIDRSHGAGLAGAVLALTLTDLRGFCVEVGKHHRAAVANERARRSEAMAMVTPSISRARTAEPTEHSRTDDDDLPVIFHPGAADPGA